MPPEQDAHGSRDILTELLLAYGQSDGSPEALLREALPSEQRRLGEDHKAVQALHSTVDELVRAQNPSDAS